MAELIAKDRERFQRASEAATRPFLAGGAAADRTAEVLSRVVEWYVKDVDAVEAAAELGVEKPADLAAAVRSSRILRGLGLEPLGTGGIVSRASWESVRDVVSAFQRAARELDLGRPYTKF